MFYYHPDIEYLATCSGGNDSVALLQYLYEENKKFAVIYNNTGWAKDDWHLRIQSVIDWCTARGIPFHETQSEGMIPLVKRKKGWPMPASKMQWCTQELKEKPTTEFLNNVDPFGELTIVTGRRREESQNRADLPQWVDSSPKHGGRECWNPLYLHDEAARDELIERSGFAILPHSSQECYPCVCANKVDLAAMPKDDTRVQLIETVEIDMGFTRNEKPRTMFRPYRVGGGVGIRQAIEWGHGPRGWKAESIPDQYQFTGEVSESESDIAYEADTKEGREFAKQCDGGYCGN